MNKKLSSSIAGLIAGTLLFSGCHRVPDTIEPKIDQSVQTGYLLSLPSPFPPLSEEEKHSEWGREYRIALGFAKEFDLYQAITGFKRSIYLLPPSDKERKAELEYRVIFCYYLAKKYADAVGAFETSSLRFAGGEFPASRDLCLILFDAYTQTNRTDKAVPILRYLHSQYPKEAEKLLLGEALIRGEFPVIESFSDNPDYPYLSDFLTGYRERKKSVGKAQTLNAVLPGAGYLYLGQKQSALTAFLLNGLFIGASYYFFYKGNIPAGVIFTSFEAGWYFGGIYGAGEEAKFYNERMYEKCATPLMNERKLFPVLSLRYAF